jgi:O-antigen/teichoic acid export membrane protein
MSETPVDDWSGGLTKQVLAASTWAVASGGVTQALRLGTNLILSRLLFPEAFGMMAIVSSVLAGLEMFSDPGCRSIHNQES